MQYILEFARRPRIEGEVAIHGVDMGNGTKPIYIQESHPKDITKLPVGEQETNSFSGNKPIIVLKIPGGMHWSRRGDPFVYHGAQFLVLKVIKITEEDDAASGGFHRYYFCDPMIEIPIRK